jgi:hypothetical protein
MYSSRHVRDCYNALVNSTNAYARTGISYSQSEDEVFAKGADQVERAGGKPALTRQERDANLATESMLWPNNICVWRKVHLFVEVHNAHYSDRRWFGVSDNSNQLMPLQGFPEASLWDDDLAALGQAYVRSLGVGTHQPVGDLRSRCLLYCNVLC